jgi:hypothetical protein
MRFRFSAPMSFRFMRAAVAVLVAAAVMVSSLHHLSCADDEGTAGAVAAIGQTLDKAAPAGGCDHGLQADCHCVCHGAFQAFAAPSAAPADVVASAYRPRTDAPLRILAYRAPFEPPRV